MTSVRELDADLVVSARLQVDLYGACIVVCGQPIEGELADSRRWVVDHT